MRTAQISVSAAIRSISAAKFSAGHCLFSAPAPAWMATSGRAKSSAASAGRAGGGARVLRRRPGRHAPVGRTGAGDGIDEGDQRLADMRALVGARLIALPLDRDVEEFRAVVLVEAGEPARAGVLQQHPRVRLAAQVECEVEAVRRQFGRQRVQFARADVARAGFGDRVVEIEADHAVDRRLQRGQRQ